ncbi:MULTISPECIES: hypothetical protein [unclassified Streptomyces]|uniref:hypothetical protein n=1 Tax=unclassified Streptomyces TaxID=2593676 RepID=UPI00081E300A|nr:MULTISPECIES: hypothetical protein [unclassified Streptomyces]MYZ38625.1 hypothetical protein [Streptomyces sp. SID4917]SCF99558.1 hypothetical protein GA0115259_106701 [Streptomyces sp. MnatMP-M17]
MTLSYADARARVIAATKPGWNNGTFCLDDREITENDDMFVFNVGAREFLVDNDTSFAVVGGVWVVYKSDGRVTTLPSVDVATDQSIRTRPNPEPTMS